MKRRWRRSHLSGPAEVNITAFMNLMVILVPFLLITAVFSRITILDLKLPVSGAPERTQSPEATERLQPEVIVRRNTIEVGDRSAGLLKQIPVTAQDDSDLQTLSLLLQQIKARHPAKQDIDLLLEEQIPYQRVIEIMDTLRVATMERDGAPVMAELFPAIAIGDAPPVTPSNAEGKVQ
ncbi:MAG: biopolymer transporter ExbD [Gammaproteobacteria bacterium]|jgi:biopolymer transport protein ExbD